MGSAHTRKARITVYFCFDTIWLRGYCYGVGVKRDEVIRIVKAAVKAGCVNETACRLEVRHTDRTGPKNEQWSAWVDYDGIEAPRGCRVRTIEKAANHAMAEALDNLRRTP